MNTIITVTWSDGTDSTFVVSDAATIADDDKFLKFKGKRNGAGNDMNWKINLAHVRCYSTEQVGGD